MSLLPSCERVDLDIATMNDIGCITCGARAGEN